MAAPGMIDRESGEDAGDEASALIAVGDLRVTRLARAMRAAVHRSAGLMAVPDDRATTVCTARRECVYRALEGVEGPSLAARHNDLHRLVVVVTAHLASSHEPWLPRANYRYAEADGSGHASASSPVG